MAGSKWESIREYLLEVVGFLLAVVMLIPLAIIRLADRWTMKRIRKLGGLD